MSRASSLSAAQSQWDNMLPFDDSREELAFESRCEEIENDSERLLDAVIDEDDADANLRLAELRIVLRNASVCLRAIFEGSKFDDATKSVMRLQAMRALLKAAEDADTFVAERIKLSAEDQA